MNTEKTVNTARRFNIIVRGNVKVYNLYTLFYRYLIQSGYCCKIFKYHRGVSVVYEVPFSASIIERLLATKVAENVQAIWYKPKTCTMRVS